MTDHTDLLTSNVRALIEAATVARASAVADSWAKVTVGTVTLYAYELADHYLASARNLWMLLNIADQEALAAEYGIRSNCSWRS